MPLPVKCVALLLGLGLAGTAAMAEENYIARGHGYQPGNEVLPPLNSEQDDLTLQTDVYESDLYVRQRQQKVFESRMNRFQFEQEFNTLNNDPEY